MTKPTRKLSVVAFATMLLAGYLTTALGHEVNIACPTAFGNAPDASGLIAYYPFDRNAADASGNGLNALKVNAVLAQGKVGQGYYFNGKGSYIRLPIDITPTVYPQITLTAWIKPKSTKGARYVFNQGDHGNRSLFISNGKVNASTGRGLIGKNKHAVFADRWIFVALTYDQRAGTVTLLSDVYISAAKGTLPETPRPTILLGAKAPGNSGFVGVIDEVRIYNRVLTTAQLAGVKKRSSSTAVAARPGKSKQVTKGQAKDACRDVTCPAGQVCAGGGCFDGPPQGASSKQITKGQVKDACRDVTCPAGQVCAGGGCFDSLPQGASSKQITKGQVKPGKSKQIPKGQAKSGKSKQIPIGQIKSGKSLQIPGEQSARASTAGKELAQAAAAVAQERATNTFSLGGEQQEFPEASCGSGLPIPAGMAGMAGMVGAGLEGALVIKAGPHDETVVTLIHIPGPGITRVEYWEYWESDSAHYRDQWNSKPDDIEYSVDGNNIVTASGTMQFTGRWRRDPQNKWVKVTGSASLRGDQPFTFSATCN